MLNVFERLTDYQEADEIVEESGIPGLFWKRNDYYKTTALSRIILPSPGQSLFTVVFHAEDFSESSHGRLRGLWLPPWSGRRADLSRP